MKQKLFSARALLCVVAFALCAKASAADLRFALPPETATFKTGPGVEVAKTQCLVCHSADYISTQPRLPRAFWKANIEKMKAKYGAPIPADKVDVLIEYLASNYGALDKKP